MLACVLPWLTTRLPAQNVAPARSAELYDTAAFDGAQRALKAGDLAGAMRGYCRMFERRSEGLWTMSVILLCDPGKVAEYVAMIRNPSPVFVQAKQFQGQWCYRVCAGVTRSRGEAVRWRALLPEKLQAEGPFPVEILRPCEGNPGGAPSEVASPTATVTPTHSDSTPATPKAPPALPELTGATAPLAGVQSPANRAEGETWFQKGLTAQAKGRRREAEEDYRKALEADPGRPEVLNNLGVLYLQQNRYTEAQALFQRALDRAPAYSRAHLNLAGALWGLDDRDHAILEARNAVTLDPTDVSAHLTLASFLLAAGEKAAAGDEARRVLLLDPGNSQAKVFLASAAPAAKPGASP